MASNVDNKEERHLQAREGLLGASKKIPGDFEKGTWGLRKIFLATAKPAFPETQHGVSNWGDRRELDIYIYIYIKLSTVAL